MLLEVTNSKGPRDTEEIILVVLRPTNRRLAYDEGNRASMRLERLEFGLREMCRQARVLTAQEAQDLLWDAESAARDIVIRQLDGPFVLMAVRGIRAAEIAAEARNFITAVYFLCGGLDFSEEGQANFRARSGRAEGTRQRG